jgi:hypothetical protein
MSDTVRVQFSASIGALIKGVEDAKSAIESVKESTDKVTEGAKNLLATFGLAFSAEKILAFAGQMADMGEQIERSSAILGVSTKSVQELGFIAKATGGDAQSLTNAMDRLQVNLQSAQNPTSRQALALKALGLSAKELLGVPLDEQLNRIADAASKFAPGGNLTAAVLTLMGRGAAGMLPALEKGRAGIEELRQSAENAGAIMSHDTVEALSRMHLEMVTLEASATALGGTLVAKLGGALNSVGNSITTLLGDFTAIISAGHLWDEEIEGIRYAVLSLESSLINMGLIAKDVFTLNWSEISAQWKAGTDSQESLMREHLLNLGKLILASKMQIQGQLAEVTSGKPQAPALAVPNTSAISAQMEQFQTQIKLADAAYKQTQEQLSAEVKLHQITYDQETQLLLQALDKRHTAELAALAAEQQIGGLTTAQYQKIIDERKVKDQEYAAAHQKIMNEAAEKDVQAWQSALTPLTSAFNSQLKGLLSGTESWATATKRIVEDLVMIVIQKLETLAVEQAAMGLKNLTMSATGGAGGGPMSWLGSLFGGGAAAAGGAGAAAVGGAGAAAGQAAQDTAVIANTTALTALTTGLTADVTGQTAITTALAALDADLIVLAPEIVALTAAVFENTAVLAASKLLPSYASGSWSLSHDQIALVHAGEMIAPNDGSAGALRSMLSGGGAGAGSVTAGGVTHVHNWTAWDGPSVQSWFTRGGMDQIARALSAYAPLHPSTA